jgi:plastocyanin
MSTAVEEWCCPGIAADGNLHAEKTSTSNDQICPAIALLEVEHKSPDGMFKLALKEKKEMRPLKNQFLAKLVFPVLTLSILTAGSTQLFSQDHAHMHEMAMPSDDSAAPRSAQFVVLDECDPATFNAVLGPDFCKNVALAAFGYATTLSDLVTGAQSNNPSPNWDFEPDSMSVPHGTVIKVVDQGGEPHTFTEVQQFGGGFLPPLNAPGESTVPECVGGFSKVDVAKTRIIQGSTIEIPNLSKGEHRFQCCIHPWMRATVNVR